MIPRALAVPAFVFMTVVSVIWVRSGDLSDWPWVLLFQLPLTFFAIRSLAIGVWLSSSSLTIATWFSTTSYQLDGLRRCDAIPYWGLLTKGIDTNLACMLLLTTAEGRRIAKHGTIATRQRAVSQAKQVRAAIRAIEIPVE